jgi:hypothetical protein
MLNQEQEAFTKAFSYPDALSHREISTVFIRALRKALEVAKMKKAPQVNASNTEREFPKLTASKRRADESLISGYSSEPASRRPEPWNPFDLRPEVQDTTGELATTSSRKLGVSQVGLPYAAVVVSYASLEQPSGTHKPPVMGPDNSESAASSEEAHRRMSLGDVYLHLCGMPDCTTSNAHVVTNIAPTAERQKRPPSTSQGLRTRATFCGG